MKVTRGYTFDDVLLVPKYSSVVSREHVNISTYLGKGLVLNIPIISANMKTVTGPEMAFQMACNGGIGILHRFDTDQLSDLKKTHKLLNDCGISLLGAANVGVSVGVQESDKSTLDKLIDTIIPKIICVDVAHGDHKLCLDMVEWVAEKYPSVLIVAGNVATGAGARRLWNAGADVVKVGIGPGSLCSTRIETGNGVPQLTALSNVWEEFRGIKNAPKIISDGGIKFSGDIVKALVFSHAVMLGNMLAGTDEAPGDTISKDGLKYKTYVGSSTHKTSHVEGVAALVPYKGPVSNVLKKIIEGVKSGLSYQGAAGLVDLQLDPEFVSLSHAGLTESHPHSVVY